MIISGTTLSGTVIRPTTTYSNLFQSPVSTGGGYLTLPSSTTLNNALAIGTGQFTIEFWINFITVASITEFMQFNTTGAMGASGVGPLVMYFNGSALQIGVNGGSGTPTTTGWTPTANKWYHVAATRDVSNNQRLFIDGQLKATSTSTNNYTCAGLMLGKNGTFNGYLSNLRIIKGSALYTANTTVSLEPLTAVTNTQLLTCQSSTIIDNSDNHFTITVNSGVNGSVITSTTSPFPF